MQPEPTNAFESMPQKPQSHLSTVNQGAIHGRKIDASKHHGGRESRDYESGPSNQKAAKPGGVNDIKQILGNMIDNKPKVTKK